MQISVGLMDACMGEQSWTPYGPKKMQARERVEQVFISAARSLIWDFVGWSLEWDGSQG